MPHPSYLDSLHKLLSLADYERMVGASASALKYDLWRMRELAERMGRPQACAPAIHIAGTKGKGSVAAMAASILKASGLRVGMFTSPHLHTFRERIRIDGEIATEEQFAGAVDRVWAIGEAMAAEGPENRLTTFEALTAMAFDLFRSEQVDVQILEVGLGGRLDSTNIVDSNVAVITSLSLDHTAILGGTIAEVAHEKAGIIKSQAPAVAAPQTAEAMEVIQQTVDEVGASLCLVGREVTYQQGDHDLSGQWMRVRTPANDYSFRLPLLGVHQQENAAVAIAAVEALGTDIAPHFGTQSVERGMSEVRWDGRFQVLAPDLRSVPDGGSPEGTRVVVDGAHNPYSIAKLCEAVEQYVAPERTLVVFGCSGDKDLPAMAGELAGIADGVVVSASRHPRAVPPAEVTLAFERVGVPATQAEDVASALRAALDAAGPNDLVLVTGSLFVAAEALEAWYRLPSERYPELDPGRLAVGRSTP